MIQNQLTDTKTTTGKSPEIYDEVINLKKENIRLKLKIHDLEQDKQILEEIISDCF